MQNIILILILLLSACQSKTNDINVRLKVLETNIKNYPKHVNDYHYGNYMIDSGYYRVLKAQITSKQDDIVIFTDNMYHFPVTHWRENKRQFNGTSSSSYFNRKNGCKIIIKENDSISIYLTYPRDADTLFLPLFWKRDSLGFTDIKFYKDKRGEMRFFSFSTRKIKYDEINEYYQQTYSKCSILPRLKENDIVQ